MNRSSFARLRGLAWLASGAVVASATVLWLVRRTAENHAPPEPASVPLSVREDWEEPPNSFSFEPAEAPSEGVTARPSARPTGISSPDDYDSLSPDDLGAAFLAGATDTSLDEPPSSTAELSGFQIYEADGVRDGNPSAEDDELAEIFDRRARG